MTVDVFVDSRERRGSELSPSTDSHTAGLLTTLAVAYGFYLALERATDPFDLLTGSAA